MSRGHDQHPDHHQEQHGHRNERGDIHRLDLDRVRRDTHVEVVLLVLDPAPPDQQPVGVDAVRRAGHQRAQVHARNDLHFGDILRLDDRDLIHPVGQGLVQNRKIEEIPDLHGVQIAEELGAGQAPVSAEDAVGPVIRLQPVFLVRMGAARRQRCAGDMADGRLQHRVAGAVVNRQVHVDLRDGDEPHVARRVDVQLGLVVIQQILIILNRPAIRNLQQLPVVFQRRVPDLLVLFVAHLGDALGVAHDGPGLVHTVPVLTEGRIGYDPDSDDKDQHQKQI